MVFATSSSLSGIAKEQVIRYLNQLDIPVEVVVQEKQLGTANALKCAEHCIKGDFLLLPGDNYIDAQSVSRIKEVTNAMLGKRTSESLEFWRGNYTGRIRYKHY